jgi:DNA-directed RNA polymerase beta subunit
MIQFKAWRQYTHVADGIRFPQNVKEPFLLIYFSENSNFINDYPKLNLRKLDARIVAVPITKIPRTRMTAEFRKLYRNLGLIPYVMQQKVPAGKNVIVDLSQYTNAIDLIYKPTTYRQRAGFFITNMLNQTVNAFPGNYQKVLFYSVNTSKDLKSFINKKIFPVLKNMKDGEFPFDHMILNYIDAGSSRNRLLVKDGEYKFPRVMHYIRMIKGVPAAEELESETKRAARIISKSISGDIDPENSAKVAGAIEDYLETNADEVIKITSGDASADDVRDIATRSILYGVSGDLDKANNISSQIPLSRRKLALRAVDKNFSSDLLKPEKTVNLSTDPRVQVYSPEKMVGDKSPEHVYQKRQVDFKTNLKQDLTNSFKVLEKKEIPLKFQKISFADKPQRAGEIMKSDLSIANIKLTDEFGNEHDIQMELPKIDPDTGTFRLNGKKKVLVNQIVQNPITFPKPGQSRFESSYSIFRIYAKQLRREKYLESFMSYKMPLMFLLAFSFGFDETLKLYKIKYEIVDKKPTAKEFVSKLQDGRYIIFKDLQTEVQKQLCQSFIHGKVDQYDIDAEFGTKDYFEKLIIKMTGRLNSTFLISSNLQNIIDPVVKQVLLNKQLPTELNMIMKYMAERVVEGYHISRNDISNQRIRNSEVLVHLAQKQILAAYTVYKEQVLSGNTEAKINIVPTKVLSDFLMTELVVDMEYANPIEEMSTMTRVSPVGKKVGGIPDKRAIQTDARNIHDSYFGNIDPLDTPESENIGIVQQLTIDALISSSRGLFATKNITNTEGTGMLSTTTSMIPFLENTDGARVIMLSNQSKQMLPLRNPQPPVVQSGYESILTGVLSDNFVKRSPCNGKILSVTKDKISIQCGKTRKVVDISPIHLRSGSGKNTLSVFNSLVEPGDTVKTGEVIAEGACMSKGSISLGRPLLTALMPYNGYNFEDGTVISESVVNQDKLTSLHGIEEEVLVSPDDRILFIAEIGQDIEKGQPLLRKTIGEVEQIIGFEEDETTDMFAGQFVKKSPGGKIVDIEVYSNVGEDKFPPLTDLIKRTNKKHTKPPRESFTVKGETIKGALVKFRIEQELRVGLGDKLCNRYGNKGIISLIEKDDLMPRLPNGERVEIILNPIGLLARMNLGQLYEMYCGLMARELGRRIPTLTKEKTAALIKQVYGQLDTSTNKKNTEMIVDNIGRLSNANYKKMINQVKKTGFYPIIIPPFQAPKQTDIKNALKVLGLKTAYKLTLPQYNTKTQKEVPVGYMYISKLEHLGSEKIYGRSTGPVTGKTAQPTAGKRREGGQRLGELDTYSFISYNCPSVLAEFMGPLSDDYITKEEIMAEIVQKGSAGYKEPKISPARDLLNSYFISLMLVR